MTRVRRLAIVLALNLALIAGLVVVGLRARSLGVLAAGVDYLADASAIGISLLAIWLEARPPRPGRPGGYPHATNTAALVNAGWLLVVTIGVIITGIRRLAAGTPRVDGLPVLIASAVAAVAMLAGALVLRGDTDDEGDEEDLNVKAVLLDTAADAAAAGGVAIAGGIILATGGWYWLDPTIAVTIAVVVGYHALRLIQRVITAIRSPARAGPAPGRDRN